MLTLIALALPLLQAGGSVAPEDTAKAITRLEDELTLALNRYDAAALDRLWSDDLTFVFPNGSIAGKAQRLAGLKSPPPSPPKSANESVDVKGYGDVAVAIVVSRWSNADEAKPPLRFRATHVWARRAGEWKLVSAHVSQMRP
jgi:ketosteroid isomerase-like protein